MPGLLEGTVALTQIPTYDSVGLQVFRWAQKVSRGDVKPPWDKPHLGLVVPLSSSLGFRFLRAVLGGKPPKAMIPKGLFDHLRKRGMPVLLESTRRLTLRHVGLGFRVPFGVSG